MQPRQHRHSILSPDHVAAETKVSPKEVEEFSAHSLFLRSVYTFVTRIWRDSDEGERKVVKSLPTVL